MGYKQILKQQQSSSLNKKIDDTSAFVLESDHQGRAIELDVRLRTNDRYAWPYSYKTGIKFDVSGEIVIYFTTHTLIIAGRNLAPLYDGLIKHEVTQIREHDAQYDDLPERATVISTIMVEEVGRT